MARYIYSLLVFIPDHRNFVTKHAHNKHKRAQNYARTQMEITTQNIGAQDEMAGAIDNVEEHHSGDSSGIDGEEQNNRNDDNMEGPRIDGINNEETCEGQIVLQKTSEAFRSEGDENETTTDVQGRSS